MILKGSYHNKNTALSNWLSNYTTTRRALGTRLNLSRIYNLWRSAFVCQTTERLSPRSQNVTLKINSHFFSLLWSVPKMSQFVLDSYFRQSLSNMLTHSLLNCNYLWRKQFHDWHQLVGIYTTTLYYLACSLRRLTTRVSGGVRLKAFNTEYMTLLWQEIKLW